MGGARLGAPAIHWNLRCVGVLAFLGGLGTAAGTVAWFKEARSCPLHRVAAGAFAVPVFGLVLAAAFEGSDRAPGPRRDRDPTRVDVAPAAGATGAPRSTRPGSSFPPASLILMGFRTLRHHHRESLDLLPVGRHRHP
jgi:hypothetical protein